MHDKKSPLAGKFITLKQGTFKGQQYRVEDWWDRVYGESWMIAGGNPACLEYAIRSAGSTPIDDEMLYGKIGMLGHLVHISEI